MDAPPQWRPLRILADRRVVHERERLPLGVESGDDL
jgi:hypothetical protein